MHARAHTCARLWLNTSTLVCVAPRAVCIAVSLIDKRRPALHPSPQTHTQPQELYKPPYLFASNRPALAKPDAPSWVPYGGTVTLGYSFPDAPGELALKRARIGVWRQARDIACVLLRPGPSVASWGAGGS